MLGGVVATEPTVTYEVSAVTAHASIDGESWVSSAHSTLHTSDTSRNNERPSRIGS
jgi:hypothetical protein